MSSDAILAKLGAAHAVILLSRIQIRPVRYTQRIPNHGAMLLALPFGSFIDPNALIEFQKMCSAYHSLRPHTTAYWKFLCWFCERESMVSNFGQIVYSDIEALGRCVRINTMNWSVRLHSQKYVIAIPLMVKPLMV